jgi:hypothetical protein
MKFAFNKLGLLGIIAVGLLLGGCILISGTFVIVQTFDLSAQSGFYYYNVDITEEPDWEDHKDNIDAIESVGFELWTDNFEGEGWSFDVYLDGADQPVYTDRDDVIANATQVLDGLAIPRGPMHLTYGESFAYVINVETMKALVKTGQFHYYGFARGELIHGYEVDSGKVIVTVAASK